MSQHVAHRRSDEVHELRAENERLRAVLKRIAELGAGRGGLARTIARNALETTPACGG